MSRLSLAAVAVALLTADAAFASCVNKFVSRSDGPRQVVTLLTGKLTYDEAQKLADAIGAGDAPPLEWVNDSGKVIARQFGELRVIRPMPVRCDDRPSGVVMTVTFATVQKPSKKIHVKLNTKKPVTFDEQS